MELYLGEDLGVSPKDGLATLARYLFEKELFLTNNNKPVSFNTIRGELNEIIKEMKRTNPRGKNNKK